MSTGMEGFSEKGSPEDWDMALGTVRGYRWWMLNVVFEDAYKAMTSLMGHGSYDNVYYTVQRYLDTGGAVSTNLPRYIPTESYVTGMYGQKWTVFQRLHGRYEAKCQAMRLASNPTVAPRSHQVPASECGCGFWAYWREEPDPSDAFKVNPLAALNDRKWVITVPLYGVIEGSGRTIIGTEGFRSQYATIPHMALLEGYRCRIEEIPPRVENIYSWGDPKPCTYVAGGGPVQYNSPLAEMMESRLEMNRELFSMFISDLAKNALEPGITWHPDYKSLYSASPPDENYA